MKTRKHLILFVCLGMMTSFIYGALTVKYKIFPFHQLKALKDSTNANASSKPRQPFRSYYYDKKSFFDQLPKQHYDIVFIGDSIIDGAEWQDLFPGRKIANRGINGDRTDGLLDRLDHVYATSAKRVFIMIGVNDFNHGRSSDKVYRNYRKIIRYLTKRGIKVYIQSTLLVGESRKKINNKIIALNRRLIKMARYDDSVTFIDLNKTLAPDSVLQARFTSDDLHLNGTGYVAWKDIIKPYIQKID